MTLHLTPDYHFDAHASISLNNRILEPLPILTFQLQVLLSLFRHTSVSSANLNDAYVFLPFDTLSTLYLKEMANMVDGLGDVVELVDKVVMEVGLFFIGFESQSALF